MTKQPSLPLHLLSLLSALALSAGCVVNDDSGTGSGSDDTTGGADDDDSSPSTLTNPTGVDSTGDSDPDTTAGTDSSGSDSGGSDTTAGPDPVCGDGVVEGDEDCDDRVESRTCNADCTAAACGDGILNETAGETCDDGNGDGFDFCDNECAPAPAVVLDMTHTFDTDTGELDGAAQANFDPATGTWYLSGFELQEAASLTVTGSSGLTIAVEGDAIVAGTLDVSGEDGGSPTQTTTMCDTAGVAGLGGPGGFAGGVGGGEGGTGTEDGAPGGGPGLSPAGGGMSSTVGGVADAVAGGGGGGHVSAGAAGSAGNGGTAGTGGEMHMSLPPLIGGGGGGGGGIEKDGAVGAGLEAADDEGSGGGGGGGAVAIEATGSITVTGTIDASGGDGGGPVVACGADIGGFGGGGAGGTISLDSPATDVALGTLDVGGGLGGDLEAFGNEYNGGDGADGNLSVN